MGWFEDVLSDGDVWAAVLGSAVGGVGGIFQANAQSEAEDKRLQQQLELQKDSNLVSLLGTLMGSQQKPLQRQPLNPADYLQIRQAANKQQIDALDALSRNYIGAIKG